MKIGFIYSNSKLSGKLTKFWTNSYCYHVVIVDEKFNKVYDQHLVFRRRSWPQYINDTVVLVESPADITMEYLEHLLDTDTNIYGWKDYILFALRPFYHLFGKSTPNAGGVICSELIYNILVDNGWKVKFHEVPSPADLERVLLNGKG